MRPKARRRRSAESDSTAIVELRRARPLLGTIVEIRVGARNHTLATRALQRAFAAVARVHQLMSYHETSSDVARLNRHASRRRVAVHAWTAGVLRRALALHVRTGGRFDVAVAPTLARLGRLPAVHGPRAARGAATADIVLFPRHRVRFRRPLRIDLGGIAKGYAVDRAIAALRAAGATMGVVNAGGDLRVFGPRPELVHVRAPDSPGTLAPLTRLHDAALATSSHYFAARRSRRRPCASIVDPRTHRPSSAQLSVSVRADECWLADALCKFVWLAGPDACGLLRSYRARAWIFAGRPPATDLHALR